MNFWELHHILEEQKSDVKTVRWMIRDDVPEVVQLLSKHNDFAGNDNIEGTIISLLRRRNAIGMVAKAQDESVVGAMIYFLQKQSIEMPVLVGNDKQVVEKLLDTTLKKLGARLAIHIKTHYNDMAVLKALKAKGFKTETQGDWILATSYNENPKEPHGNMTGDHVDPYEKPNWDEYHGIIGKEKPVQPQTPEEPPESFYEKPEPERTTQNDPWGLFKNKPWKDKERGDEEMV